MQANIYKHKHVLIIVILNVVVLVPMVIKMLGMRGSNSSRNDAVDVCCGGEVMVVS